MKSLPIKELITEIITGEWGIDAIKDKGVAVIRTANFLNSGQIDFSKIVRREIDKKKVSKKKLFSGDIIIEKSGGSPIQPVGRVVLFKNPDKDTYLCNNFTSVLRPNRDIVFPEYLFYALHYNHKKGKTLRYQNKTTGIINLKLDKYLSSEIHIPPLDDQIRIATLLSKVECLISRRREQLKKLDELLKSIFLEMFGDPVRNENGWDKKPIGSFADVGTGGTPSRKKLSDYYDGNIFWVKTTEVKNAEIYCTKETITATALSETNCRIYPPNTILLAMYGQGKTRGQVGYLKVNAATNQACAAILPSLHNQIFIYEQLKYLYKSIRSLARGGNQENLNLNIVRNIALILPSKNLQNQFADIVEMVEGIKSLYKQSLAELENLYGTLSQKAFTGELDLSRLPLVKEIVPGI